MLINFTYVEPQFKCPTANLSIPFPSYGSLAFNTVQQTKLSFKVYHEMPFLSTDVASRLKTNAILVVVVVVVVSPRAFLSPVPQPRCRSVVLANSKAWLLWLLYTLFPLLCLI